MTKRKSISKKLRFEVFKRDKFQCQYCGKSAPDVILNVDHIDPVANGGSNELINLITSCFDCNQGKKARLLSDDTIVQKQRKQLELIQERREQLELMLDWKKSLNEFEEEKITMVSDYWASMMNPYSLNENGLKSLEKLMKEFTIEDILESIDIATKKYIKFDEKGEIIKESVEMAFNKVGGICALKNMPEINQKLAYVKGICRNRFSYWDDRKGSLILNNYIDALKNYGWDNEGIVNDIEDEVIPKTKEAKNWTQWKNLIEQWTDDVNGWEKEVAVEHVKEFSVESLETHANIMFGEMKDRVDALIHIGQIFPLFKKSEFKRSILSDVEQVYKSLYGDSQDFSSFVKSSTSLKFFKIPENPCPDNLGILMVLENTAFELIESILDSFYLENSNYSDKDKKILNMLIEEQMNNTT